MKWGLSLCLGILVLWSLLALVQLWGQFLSGDVFIKLSISALVLFLVIGVITLAIREYLKDKDLRDKGFVD